MAKETLKMTTIYYSFSQPENARRFVAAVLDHGATSEQVSVVAQEGVAWNSDTDSPEMEIEKSAESGITTTTAGDAASGAVKGAGVGAGVGILASLAALLIPGVGLVVGGGALAIALAGAAGTVGAGAVAGGVFGYLRDQGMPNDVSEAFESDYRANHVIVGVNLDPEGLPINELSELADKYHAVRRSDTYPAMAR